MKQVSQHQYRAEFLINLNDVQKSQGNYLHFSIKTSCGRVSFRVGVQNQKLFKFLYDLVKKSSTLSFIQFYSFRKKRKFFLMYSYIENDLDCCIILILKSDKMESEEDSIFAVLVKFDMFNERNAEQKQSQQLHEIFTTINTEEINKPQQECLSINSKLNSPEQEHCSQPAKKVVKKWNTEENHLYAQFLEMNIDYFQDEKDRRGYKVFQQMSKRVNSRTPQQCRSHHQKMLSKYKNIEKIISIFLIKSMQEPQKIIFQKKLSSRSSSISQKKKYMKKNEENMSQEQFSIFDFIF